MGVAEQVHDQLPVAPEDDRYAWSEAGGRPHIIRIHYPIRPGYGQHPAKVAAIGVVVLLIARWLQGFLHRLSDGKELTSLLERVPGQIDLIEGIAAVLAALCWLPLIWAAWSILAGLVDCVATRVRIGFVARVRVGRATSFRTRTCSTRSPTAIDTRPTSPSTTAAARRSSPGWRPNARRRRKARRHACGQLPCSASCGRPSRSARRRAPNARAADTTR